MGLAAQSGEAILVEDVRLDPRYIGASQPTRAELALPLKVKDRVIGVLDLGALEPGVFGPAHLALLEPVAGQLAAAIDGARLTQSLLQQTQTLSLLHELGREFASILDRKKLLARVADRIQRLIHYDVFTVMLWNEESRQLEPQLAVYRDGRRVSSARPTGLGEGICGTAAALRQTLRIPNVQLDPRYIECVRERTMRSELAVPMYVKDRLVGVLDLESSSYDAFTTHHEHAVSTLAASLAIALENARLYGRLQEDERRLAADLSTAREIQKQLLPKTTPWLPGLQVAFAYRPANHLGGDFYDIRRYGEGRVAIAAGDVSGKATSAALYGSLAVGMLRQYPEEGLRPGALLRDMNSKLLELGIPNRFLALALALYDAGDRSLVLANSGLPHPFLVRGGEVRPIPVVGVPLGLLPDRRYEEELITLETGDVVVIATDGIDESHNRDDEEFGAQGVRQTLERLGRRLGARDRRRPAGGQPRLGRPRRALGRLDGGGAQGRLSPLPSSALACCHASPGRSLADIPEGREAAALDSLGELVSADRALDPASPRTVFGSGKVFFIGIAVLESAFVGVLFLCLNFWPCPSCGRFFFLRFGILRAAGKHCPHCGLRYGEACLCQTPAVLPGLTPEARHESDEVCRTANGNSIRWPVAILAPSRDRLRVLDSRSADG